MLEYAKTPTVLTKRIIITPENKPSLMAHGVTYEEFAIDVDFLIREPRDYSWFQIPEFKKYINVYVLQVMDSPDYAQSLYNMLYDTEYRWDRLKEWLLVTNQMPAAEVESQYSIEGIFDVFARFNDARSPIVCHKYNLNDVIMQHSDALVSRAESDLDLNSGTGAITSKPFDYLFTKSYKTARSIENLSFICFSHVDVEQIVEDFSIDPTVYPTAVDELHKVAGITTMDIVFENGKVPTQSLLYVYRDDETKIWNGPVHYTNPDETGYVGWKGGTLISEGPRPRLKQVPVRNTKVKYDAEPSSFGYYGGDPDPEDASYYPISVGNYDFSTVQRSIDMISRMTFDTNDVAIRDKFEEVLRAHRGKNVIDGFMETTRDLAGTAKMVFSFDYVNLIKQNSKYGYFLDVVPVSLKASMLANSKILSLKILRKRVSNYPTGIGYFGENDYKPMDTDDIPHLVVESADSDEPLYNHKLITKIQKNKKDTEVIGKIEECSISLPEEPNPEWFRHFVAMDYDFGRVTAGVYTYELHLVVKDGIEQTLRSVLKEARDAEKGLSDFIGLARIPKIKYKTPENRYYDYHHSPGDPYDIYELGSDPTGQSSGHYDYENKTFTDEFREKVDIMLKLERAISVYVFLRSTFAYLTRSALDIDWHLLQTHIEVNTSPNLNGTLDACEVFHQRYLDMIAFLAQILKDKSEEGSSSYASDLSAQGARLNSYKPPAHIEVCKDYKVYINAHRRPVARSYFGSLATFTGIANIIDKINQDRNLYNLPLNAYTGPGTLIFPDAYLRWGSGTYDPDKGNMTSPIRDFFDSPGQKSKYNKTLKKHYEKNVIFESKFLDLTPLENKSAIKYGLDRVTKRSVENSSSGAGEMFSTTFDVTGLVGYIEGVSVGALGHGTGHAFEKLHVATPKNTLTHENFNNLLCSALYISDSMKDYRKFLRNIIKERDYLINLSGLMEYVEVLKNYRIFGEHSTNGPYHVSRKYLGSGATPGIKNVGRFTGIFDDLNKAGLHNKNASDIKNKYLLGSPSELVVRTKISSSDNIGLGSSLPNKKPAVGFTPLLQDAKSNRDSESAFSVLSRKSRTSVNRTGGPKRIQILSVQPVVDQQSSVGKTFKENNFDTVDSTILVEF